MVEKHSQGDKVPLRCFLLMVLCFFLVACSSTNMQLRHQTVDAFARGDFAAAEREAIQPDLAKEFQNRLLTLLDLGTIAHYAGLYEKSNYYFFRAKDLARQLYTVSIREQIATGLLNDNSAAYVGMEYEISLLRYYIVSNFLLLSESDRVPAWTAPEIQSGKEIFLAGKKSEARTLAPQERRESLSRARSELLDWNAYLREVRENNLGQPYYKDDLLNKVFAAYVHRMVGSTQDQNTAQILLRDAEEILVKAYSAYPSFNSKANDYLSNYGRFAELGAKTVKEQFIQKTTYYESAERLIRDAEKKPGNLLYVVEYGMVPRRQEKSYVIGLSTLFREIKDPVLRRQVEEIGTHVLLQLAPQFGLAFVGATVVGAATGKNEAGERPKYLTEAVDSAIGFEFKLPSIPEEVLAESYALKFVRNDGQEYTSGVSLMTPLNDIARLNVERRAAAIAFKTGVRVGLKYLAALVPAIVTYRKVSGPEFVKVMAATAVWMAGKKIVDATEAADIRAWNLLPKWIGVAEVQLPSGEYAVSATRLSDQRSLPLQKVQIKAPEQKLFLKTRILSDQMALQPGPLPLL